MRLTAASTPLQPPPTMTITEEMLYSAQATACRSPASAVNDRHASFGKTFFRFSDLWRVVDHDVHVVWVQRRVVLVVILGGVERRQLGDFGDDRTLEHARAIELRDVGVRDLLLLVIGEENGGPVLAMPLSGSLPVQGRWIVRDALKKTRSSCPYVMRDGS